jgi:hypothetical protein
MPQPSERETLIMDVAGVIAGGCAIAIGYSIQFNNIAYPAGDYRNNPSYGATAFTIGTILALFMIVVFSIKLIWDLRHRRHKDG